MNCEVAWMGDVRSAAVPCTSPQLDSPPGSGPAERRFGVAAQSADATVAAIDAALARPGKSVAIYPIDDLLREGGVLARLRAEGATISTPEVLKSGH